MTTTDQDWEMLARHEAPENRAPNGKAELAADERAFRAGVAEGRRSSPSGGGLPASGYPGWKLLVLVEISVLVGGRIVLGRRAGVPWIQLLASKQAFRNHAASILLLAVLTTMADLGAGPQAAGLGAAVSISYLMGAAGLLGGAILQVENELFGTGYGGTPSPGSVGSQANQAA